MAHLRLGVQPLWLEGIVTTDYERDTLPLIFASDHDFNVYYHALGAKNPRKKFELTRMKDLSARARALRAAGRLPEALACMQGSLAARKEVFHHEDYQVVSAQLHLCLTAVHFASHAFVRQDFPACYELFKAAQKTTTAELTPAERPFIEMILYSNWVGYWYRRGRPSLAARASRSAVANLHKAFGMMGAHIQDTREAQILLAFFYARYGTAMLRSKDYASARDWLLKALAAVQRLEDTMFTAPAAEKPRGKRGELNINAETLSFSNWVTGVNPDGWGVAKASLCITSACKQYDTQWPLVGALRMMVTFNVGLADVYLLRYASGLGYFRRAVEVCNAIYNETQIDCNEHWWKTVETATQAVESLADQTEGKVKRVEHQNAKESGLHTLLMASKPRVATQNNSDIKFYRKRQKRQREKGQSSDEEGGVRRQDMSLVSTGGGRRMKPSCTSHAAKDDLSDSGDETAAMWETLIPCLRKKMPFKEYQQLTKGQPVAAAAEQDFRKVARRVLSKQSRVLDSHRRERRDRREAQRRDFSTAANLSDHCDTDTATLHEASPIHAPSQFPPKYHIASVLNNATYQSPHSKGYDFAKSPKQRAAKPPPPPASPPPANTSLKTGIDVYAKKAVSKARQRTAGFVDEETPTRRLRGSDPDDILNESILEWYSEYEGASPEGDGGVGEGVASEHNTTAEVVERCEERGADLEAYLANEPAPDPQRADNGYCDTSATAAPGGGGFEVPPPASAESQRRSVGSRARTPSTRKASFAGMEDEPGREGAQSADLSPPKAFGAEMRHRLTGAGLSELEMKKLQAVTLGPLRGSLKGKGKKPVRRDSFLTGVGSVYGSAKLHQRAGGVWPDDPPVPMKRSLIGDVQSAGDRQRRLRALLPNLDPNGDMYRMVVKELACNTQAMTKTRLRNKLLAATKSAVNLNPTSQFAKIAMSLAGGSTAGSSRPITAGDDVSQTKPEVKTEAKAASPTPVAKDDPEAVEVAKWLLAATFAVSSQCSDDFLTAYDTKTIATHDALPESPPHAPDGGTEPPVEEAVPMPPMDD
eukprot:TRINITY_DN19255_c0_g1_i1.p1 TRINITY_DN19255_c0_g1~~TRINITY_DN19255_c0_g1_i1.p1  ORF type:complete len:1046 (+),score=355.86 TRINITY_DN19255_c0_g1_i1:110-3247(+)